MSSANTTRVAQGRIAGELSRDGAVVAYKGLPYAAPPVGPLRWRPPTQPPSWDGTREATRFGPSSPQYPLAPDSLYAGGHESQSEDCLTLNVWTQAGAGPQDAGRPVLVWFHLGAFQYGAGSVPLYDGEALARAGAVVITVNYRLNRVGFLAHPWLSAESESGTSGNYGLLDQLASLHWARENCTAFGGDPKLITAIGLSAGSSSVSLLLASPLAQGAFSRAVAMSGAQLGPVGHTGGIGEGMQDLTSAERSGDRVARELGVRNLEELRQVSVEDLMAVTPESDSGPSWSLGQGMRIGRGVFDSSYPIVDGHVIPEAPIASWKSGRFAEIPLLTGSSANEAAGLPFLRTLEDYRDELGRTFGENREAIFERYPAVHDADVPRASAAVNADRIFIWQNWALARLHSRAAAGATFYYHSARVPPVSPPDAYAERDPGAFHGHEIPYVFRNLDVRPWPWLPIDRQLSETMSRQWLRFAETGSPNAPGLPEWRPFDESAPEAMTFTEAGAAMEPVRRLGHLQFWDRWSAEQSSSETEASV